MKGARWQFWTHSAKQGGPVAELAEVSGRIMDDKQALAFANLLWKRVKQPIGRRFLTSAGKVGQQNPTLVHHGFSQGAGFHVLTEAGAPLADLYMYRSLAEPIARALANVMGIPVLLSPNDWAGEHGIKDPTGHKSPIHEGTEKVAPTKRNPAVPRGTKTYKGVYYFRDQRAARLWAESNGWPLDRIIEYVRGWAVQSGKSGNYAGPGETPRPWRGFSNPSGKPVAGETWHTVHGGRCKIISVRGSRVTILHMEDGNRETIDMAEFLASYRFGGRTARNPRGGPRVVYNRLLGGWYVVTGPHQTPLNGRFNSKAEAQAWLSGGSRRNPSRYGRSGRKSKAAARAERLTVTEQYWIEPSTPSELASDPRSPYRMVTSGGQRYALSANDAIRAQKEGLEFRARSNPSRSKRARAGRSAHRQVRHELGARVARASARAVRRPARPGNAAQALYYLQHHEARSARRKSGRSNPRIVVGDRVKYSAAWLRSTGTYAGTLPHARGVVTAILPKFGRDGLATIAWDREGVPEKVLVANLVKVGAIEHNPRGTRGKTRARLSNPTTLLEAVGQVLDAARWPGLAKDVRSGKMAPEPALELAHRSSNSMVQRSNLMKALRLVRRLSPKPNPTELARAKKTFRKWHEFDATKAKRMKGPSRTIPKTLVKLGDLVSVVYESDKYTGKRELYEHKTKRPHPVLATDPDGRNVHIIGGKMKVTADGLVN